MNFEKAMQDKHQVKSLPIAQAKPTPILNNNKQSEEPSNSIKPSQPRPELPLNSQKVLDSLEYTLAQFNQHQADILRVHEQALNHQMEYAKNFFQLMQQQNLLFGNGKAAEQQGKTKPVILESLERSMTRFHDHQDETLRIHEEYLDHQMEYAKNLFQVIQQHYNLLITGDSTELHKVSNQVAALVEG